MNPSFLRATAFLLKDRIVASPGFNRWWIPLISVALHLCIGSVYSWSIFNPALTKELGVAASSADDWSITAIVGVFSTAIVFLGLSTAVAGKWLEDVGPRCAGVCAAGLWGVGFVVAGVGIETHQIWLLYLGYGVLGGAGLGLGYITPVSTLIRWFPDRRGLSTGLAIMGFGGGAIIAAPLKKFLLEAFHEAPQYLGAMGAVDLITEHGRQYAEVGGEWLEVVVAGAADVSRDDRPRCGGRLCGRHGQHGRRIDLPHPGIGLLRHHAGRRPVLPPSRGRMEAVWLGRGRGARRRQAGQRLARHAEHRLRARPASASNAAVLSAVDHALLQRHRRDRHHRCGGDDDGGPLQPGLAPHRHPRLRGDLCVDDQRLQHGWPARLGGGFRLHRATQHLLLLLCAGRGPCTVRYRSSRMAAAAAPT